MHILVPTVGVNLVSARESFWVAPGWWVNLGKKVLISTFGVNFM